jgi:uncharacterized membrane protein YagU involved in acid resistance
MQQQKNGLERQARRSEAIWQRATAGLAGGLIGALAMNVFARVVRTSNHGLEAPGAAPGSDRDGRGMQPPQARARADQDAAVQAGTAVYRSVTGRAPDRATGRWLGTGAHYTFGAALGVVYALGSSRAPALRAGFGVFYGSLVWAIADEGAMPALGLSRGPRELPLGVHGYALAGHWVYGATLEGFMRAMERSCAPRWAPRSSSSRCCSS